MGTIPTYKTYPNVFAGGNASIHLGNVVYVSGEGDHGERIALNQIIKRIERLNRSINNNSSIHHIHESQSRELHTVERESYHSYTSVEASAMNPLSNRLDRNYLYRSQNDSNLPHLLYTSHQERTGDRYERRSITYSPIRSRLGPQRCAESKVYVKELAIGKLIVRLHLWHGSMGAQGGPTTPPTYRLSAHLIPKSWFCREAILLGLVWSVFPQEISGISLNPSFADIVPDNHPMIICAATGDVSGLKALLMLENGPRSSCTTSAGWSPLHFAAAGGHSEACQLLLYNGASPNATGDSNISPLHVSARFGKLSVFRRLLNAGGDLDDLHDHGTNPLFDLLANQSLIISEEFHDFIHWLILGQECHLVDTETTDNRGQSILNYLVEILHVISHAKADSSIAKVYVESVRALICSGIDLNARNVYGDALLHIACWYRQVDIVHMLLENECEIDVRDANDYTPLHRAVEYEDCETASILVHHGAEIEAIADPGDDLPSYHDVLCYVTPLSLVAVNGNTEMFANIWDQVLRTGKDKDFSEMYWTEFLRIAVKCKNYELVERLTAISSSKAGLSTVLGTTLGVKMIELLVLAGASPDGHFPHRPTTNWRPLLWAALNNDLDVVKKLIELGADVNCTGFEGQSALHYAAFNGGTDVADVLLSHGANREARTYKRLSPAEEAMSRRFTDFALKLSVEPVQIPTNELRLIIACETNNVDLAKGLLTAGASLKDEDFNMAITCQSFDVVEFLINAGARVHRGYAQVFRKMREDVPLLEAATNCSDKIALLLIERGADVNEILDMNNTPLLHAPDQFWSGAQPIQPRTRMVRVLWKQAPEST